MEDIRLIDMVEQHLEQVLAIEKVSYPTPWSRNAFAAEIQDNDFAHYFVCVEGKGDKVLGYVGMWVIFDEAHITNIAVAPHHRCQGLGRFLLAEAMARSVLIGAGKITLEVRPSNAAARHLYTNMGFMPRGVRKGYYTDTNEDAIIMWKHINNKERARG